MTAPVQLLTAFERRAPEPERLKPELVSVVVPVVDRQDDLAELCNAFGSELRRLGIRYEFVIVFDGGAGSVPAALREAARCDERIRISVFDQTFGEAAALRAGIERSRGSSIITMSAYFQVKAEGLGDVIEAANGGADLVVTRRWPRTDGWLNRLQSRAFHWLVRSISGTPFRDMACGLRYMRRDVAEAIPLYGDLHRFIPALASREGFRVVEVDVEQDARDARRRVYRPGVYLRRMLDIIAFFFLAKFTDKPLRFFGLVGSMAAVAGLLISGVLFLQRLTGTGIANRPLLLLGVLLVALGVQLIGLGLVGEIIVHLHAPQRRAYRIRETT